MTDRFERLCFAAATAAVAFLVAALWWPAARLDFYFDEMWRVEQIRSATPVSAYLDGPAPIPPGWTLTLSTLFDVVPARRPLMRLAAVGVAVPSALLLMVTLRNVLAVRFTRHRAVVVATIASVATFALPAIAVHMTYLNNYLADVAYAVVMLWILVEIDLRRAPTAIPWWALVATCATMPWFAQGALLLVPVAAVVVVRRRSGRERFVVGSAIGLAISLVSAWWFFLRPVADGATLTEYWRADTPSTGVVPFAERFATTFVDAAYPPSIGDRPMLLVLAFAASVCGAVTLQRCWRWWLPLFAGAQVLAIAGSLTSGWPATFVRNNSSFQILVFATAPVGVALAIIGVVDAIRARGNPTVAARWAAWAVGATAIALFAGVVAPRSIRANAQSTTVFARGLTDDVSLVARRSEPGDAVVAYHLSGPYVRDRLLNAADAPRDLTVLDEARIGPDVLDALDRRIPMNAATTWCVVPFEAGPDDTARACAFGDGWQRASTATGTRATIIEMRRA